VIADVVPEASLPLVVDVGESMEVAVEDGDVASDLFDFKGGVMASSPPLPTPLPEAEFIDLDGLCNEAYDNTREPDAGESRANIRATS